MTTKEARRKAVELLGEDAVAYHLPRRRTMQRYFMGSKAQNRGVFGPTWESCVAFIERNPEPPPAEPVIPSLEKSGP